MSATTTSTPSLGARARPPAHLSIPVALAAVLAADCECGGTVGGKRQCAPKTCVELGVACGPAADGCGTTLDCGPCENPTQYSVTVSLLGAGTGTVTCGGTACPARVDRDTSLTFTATPGAGSSFAGWGGACAGVSLACALVVFADVSVTATFTIAINPPTATYWVSPTGAAAWTACSGETPLSGTAACSMSTANAELQAGELAYLRTGSYGVGIAPVASGTASDRIVYRGYAGETATITGTPLAIDLGGSAYVSIENVTADGNRTFADLRGAHHVWVFGCTLINSTATTGWPVGVLLYDDAQYNWLANNVIGHSGFYTDDDDMGGVMNVGNWENASDTTSYNLIEGNHFYHGGHHIIEVAAHHNIFKNNTFHNENWSPCPRPSTGNLCGDRDILTYEDSPLGVFNILDGNRFAFAGASIDDATGAAGASIRGTYTIIRNNLIFYNDGPGLDLYSDGSTTFDPRHSRVYHNTFYRNGVSPLSATDFRYTFGAVFDNVAGNGNPTPIVDVAFKNNLLYDNVGGDVFFYYTDVTEQAFEGNFLGAPNGSNAGGYFDPVLPASNVVSAADPLFVDVSLTADANNVDAFDFHLQATSPAINRGVFLTTTTSAGSGTSIPVVDAGYFTDGLGITRGDLIQLEGQTQTARIVQIDYGTNQLTVDTALTWNASQGVSLPYSGEKPDCGAHEHGDG